MKKIVSAVMATAFVATAVIAFAAAKKETCKVDVVEGDKVTMTCTKPELKAGDNVEVQVKVEKPVEGC
ncbi:selenite/tellurite reduction operon protein ExtJ [Candidatus Electronema sp. PJ]|uniref:selenite/tellurite reduction operon protein ExtJ n=1 Tax=Candidatus Electronema sp. PJ TaxID=3401572 RepID=UPI003AA85619